MYDSFNNLNKHFYLRIKLSLLQNSFSIIYLIILIKLR